MATTHRPGPDTQISPAQRAGAPTARRANRRRPHAVPPAYAAVGPWQAMEAQHHPTPPAPAGLNPTTIQSADTTTPLIPIAIPTMTATPYGGEGP
jgi:hypothetical protein